MQPFFNKCHVLQMGRYYLDSYLFSLPFPSIFNMLEMIRGVFPRDKFYNIGWSPQISFCYWVISLPNLISIVYLKIELYVLTGHNYQIHHTCDKRKDQLTMVNKRSMTNTFNIVFFI